MAVDITSPKQLMEFVAQQRKKLGTQLINWTDPKLHHVTLRFLGNTDKIEVERIVNALLSVAAHHAPMQIEVKGLGMFPNAKSPHVWWAGIEQMPQFENLAIEVNRELDRLGFEKPHGYFNPHLTLARIKKTATTGKSIAFPPPDTNKSWGSTTISAFILYQNIFTPTGPKYNCIYRFSLSASSLT